MLRKWLLFLGLEKKSCATVFAAHSDIIWDVQCHPSEPALFMSCSQVSQMCVCVGACVSGICVWMCERERVCVCVCVCACMSVLHMCVCVCVCDVGKKCTCTSRYKNIKSTLFLSLKNILPCFWLWGCVVKITPTTHHPEVPCAVNRMLKYYCGQYRLHMFALCFEGWQNSPLGLPGQ